jgi:hypothetical protein
MTETVLFVDFENVPKIDLERLPAGVRLEIIYDSEQAKQVMELAELARRRRVRLNATQSGGRGKNALDFHIAKSRNGPARSA